MEQTPCLHATLTKGTPPAPYILLMNHFSFCSKLPKSSTWRCIRFSYTLGKGLPQVSWDSGQQPCWARAPGSITRPTSDTWPELWASTLPCRPWLSPPSTALRTPCQKDAQSQEVKITEGLAVHTDAAGIGRMISINNRSVRRGIKLV